MLRLIACGGSVAQARLLCTRIGLTTTPSTTFLVLVRSAAVCANQQHHSQSQQQQQRYLTTTHTHAFKYQSHPINQTNQPTASSPTPSSTPSPPPTSPSNEFVSHLAHGILQSDRLSLSKAITLIESVHPHHQREASELMNLLAEHKRHHAHAKAKQEEEANEIMRKLDPEARKEAALTKPRSLRIGISGPPGVGKSTFIERFGQYLLSLGHRLAVLSIDPSSHVSGGSLLGDKTRMLELSRNENAYVRPSPSRCVLGGVGANTYDTILLCEAAGYDLVFVETVGVGQSEVSVADMVDMLILLVQPGGGDELQGMKKGIVELIDLIIVNKADGPLLTNARHTKLEYMHALQLNTRRKKETDWKPQVKLCSSVSDSSIAQADYSTPAPTAPEPSHSADQIEEIWRTIGAFEDWSKGPLGDFMTRRLKQSKALLHQALEDNLNQRLKRQLEELQEYKKLKSFWDHSHKHARPQLQPHASTVHTTSAQVSDPTSSALLSGEFVPRIEATKIIDEWLEQECRQKQLSQQTPPDTAN